MAGGKNDDLPTRGKFTSSLVFGHHLTGGGGNGIGEGKKPINIKNVSGTPPGLCPVCPVDMSHLSRHLSRLSRGHSAP